MTDEERDNFFTPIHVRLEYIRPCDVVSCTCGAVINLGALALEPRDRGAKPLGGPMVQGVYCPHCGQMLLDEADWEALKRERAQYDEQQKRSEKGNREGESVKRHRRGRTAPGDPRNMEWEGA